MAREIDLMVDAERLHNVARKEFRARMPVGTPLPAFDQASVPMPYMPVLKPVRPGHASRHRALETRRARNAAAFGLMRRRKVKALFCRQVYPRQLRPEALRKPVARPRTRAVNVDPGFLAQNRPPSELQRTQERFADLATELSNTRAELECSRADHDHTRAELDNTHAELEQARTRTWELTRYDAVQSPAPASPASSGNGTIEIEDVDSDSDVDSDIADLDQLLIDLPDYPPADV